MLIIGGGHPSSFHWLIVVVVVAVVAIVAVAVAVPVAGAVILPVFLVAF